MTVSLEQATIQVSNLSVDVVCMCLPYNPYIILNVLL